MKPYGMIAGDGSSQDLMVGDEESLRWSIIVSFFAPVDPAKIVRKSNCGYHYYFIHNSGEPINETASRKFSGRINGPCFYHSKKIEVVSG